MAAEGVSGPIGDHGSDLFNLGDLVEQFWQHGTLTIAAGGKLHRPDVGRGRVHRQMQLASLATAPNTMLARVPFAIAKEIDTGAVDERVQGAVGAPMGIFTAKVFWRRQKDV